MFNRIKNVPVISGITICFVLYWIPYQFIYLNMEEKSIKFAVEDIRERDFHILTLTPSNVSRIIPSFTNDILIELNNARIETNNTGFAIRDVKEWKGAVKTLRASDKDYFSGVKELNIKTIFVKEEIDDLKSELLPDYYLPIMSNCPSVANIDKLKIFAINCTQNITKTLESIPIDVSNLYQNQHLNSDKNTSSILTVTFIHVLNNGLVHGTNGDVITFTGTYLVKLVPNRCQEIKSSDLSRKFSERPSAYYDEVFVISQYWGKGFFHGTLEDLPRLAPYLTFLKNQPQIKIHVVQPLRFLPLLGISADRQVQGAVYAKVLYMPEGTLCGRPPLIHGQILSWNLQKIIPGYPLQRDTVVLIKRSRKRWFNNHDSILKMLQIHSEKAGLRVVVYGDAPVPSVPITQDTFHRAAIIVAPHGAGESNLIFSQPGTVLIEGLCYPVVPCYINMAQSLGLRYYGLLPRHGRNCKQISAADIEKPFLEFLNII